MSFTLSSPLSLYSVPLVWLIGFFPVVMKSTIVMKAVGFNNMNPRGNVARLKEKKVSPEIAARAARIEGAHLNGMENFPLWAIAVLVGNYAKIDPQTLNILSAIYAALRLLYNYIYINQKSQLHGAIRTLVFLGGLSIPLYILLTAAHSVNLSS